MNKQWYFYGSINEVYRELAVPNTLPLSSAQRKICEEYFCSSNNLVIDGKYVNDTVIFDDGFLYRGRCAKKTHALSPSYYSCVNITQVKLSALLNNFDSVICSNVYSEKDFDAIASSTIPDAPQESWKSTRQAVIAKQSLKKIIYGIIERVRYSDPPVVIIVPSDEPDYSGYVLSAVRQIYSYLPVAVRAKAGFSSCSKPDSSKRNLALYFIPESDAQKLYNGTNYIFLDGRNNRSDKKIKEKPFIESILSKTESTSRQKYLESFYNKVETGFNDGLQDWKWSKYEDYYSTLEELLLPEDWKAQNLAVTYIEKWIDALNRNRELVEGCIRSQVTPEALTTAVRELCKPDGITPLSKYRESLNKYHPLCFGEEELLTCLDELMRENIEASASKLDSCEEVRKLQNSISAELFFVSLGDACITAQRNCEECCAELARKEAEKLVDEAKSIVNSLTIEDITVFALTPATAPWGTGRSLRTIYDIRDSRITELLVYGLSEKEIVKHLEQINDALNARIDKLIKTDIEGFKKKFDEAKDFQAVSKIIKKINTTVQQLTEDHHKHKYNDIMGECKRKRSECALAEASTKCDEAIKAIKEFNVDIASLANATALKQLLKDKKSNIVTTFIEPIEEYVVYLSPDSGAYQEICIAWMNRICDILRNLYTELENGITECKKDKYSAIKLVLVGEDWVFQDVLENTKDIKDEIHNLAQKIDKKLNDIENDEKKQQQQEEKQQKEHSVRSALQENGYIAGLIAFCKAEYSKEQNAELFESVKNVQNSSTVYDYIASYYKYLSSTTPPTNHKDFSQQVLFATFRMYVRDDICELRKKSDNDNHVIELTSLDTLKTLCDLKKRLAEIDEFLNCFLDENSPSALQIGFKNDSTSANVDFSKFYKLLEVITDDNADYSLSREDYLLEDYLLLEPFFVIYNLLSPDLIGKLYAVMKGSKDRAPMPTELLERSYQKLSRSNIAPQSNECGLAFAVIASDATVFFNTKDGATEDDYLRSLAKRCNIPKNDWSITKNNINKISKKFRNVHYPFISNDSWLKKIVNIASTPMENISAFVFALCLIIVLVVGLALGFFFGRISMRQDNIHRNHEPSHSDNSYSAPADMSVEEQNELEIDASTESAFTSADIIIVNESSDSNSGDEQQTDKSAEKVTAPADMRTDNLPSTSAEIQASEQGNSKSTQTDKAVDEISNSKIDISTNEPSKPASTQTTIKN